MMDRQLRNVAAVGALTIVLLIGMVVWSYIALDRLRQESEIVTELNKGLNDLQYLTTEYLTTMTPRALEQWQGRHASFGELIERSSIRDETVRRLLPEIQARHRVMGSVFDKLVRLDASDLSAARIENAERAIVTRLLNQILALATLKERISKIYDENERLLLRRVLVALLSTLIVGGGAVALMFARVLRRLNRNVDMFSDAVTRLGAGETDIPIDSPEDQVFRTLFEALEQTRNRLVDAVERMRQERADVDNFVYVASHDLKAPLRGIDSLAIWIEEDAGDVLGPEAKEHLGKLRARVSRLESLLDDLLAYSRAGRDRPPAETVNVGGLVRDVIADLHLPPGISVKIDPNMPVILSPRGPLEHVFFNLIGNAAKHHDRERGVIQIDGHADGNGARFRVYDDGPGIPDRFREKVFEMFQTLRPRDEIEGSGMGLAITKRLVQSYNGEIELKSGAGRGSLFEFSWYPDIDVNGT